MRAQIAAFALGVWLTASPDVLDTTGPARTSANIVGPLAAMFALIAVFEITRSLRRLNLLAAVWLVFAPWVLGFAPADIAHSTGIGMALGGLSLVRGRREESFGGGWRVLWAPVELHKGESA